MQKNLLTGGQEVPLVKTVKNSGNATMANFLNVQKCGNGVKYIEKK